MTTWKEIKRHPAVEEVEYCGWRDAASGHGMEREYWVHLRDGFLYCGAYHNFSAADAADAADQLEGVTEEGGIC